MTPGSPRSHPSPRPARPPPLRPGVGAGITPAARAPVHPVPGPGALDAPASHTHPIGQDPRCPPPPECLGRSSGRAERPLRAPPHGRAARTPPQSMEASGRDRRPPPPTTKVPAGPALAAGRTAGTTQHGLIERTTHRRKHPFAGKVLRCALHRLRAVPPPTTPQPSAGYATRLHRLPGLPPPPTLVAVGPFPPPSTQLLTGTNRLPHAAVQAGTLRLGPRRLSPPPTTQVPSTHYTPGRPPAPPGFPARPARAGAASGPLRRGPARASSTLYTGQEPPRGVSEAGSYTRSSPRPDRASGGDE